MNINWPKPGKYIVAVSGGVDSVSLLDILVERGEYDLVVAHVDHGMRPDSSEDFNLVESLAAAHKLTFESTKLSLGSQASEQMARQARYDFLFDCMRKQHADGIITAHHADDLLETSILNVQRGTDRYGAAGGMSRTEIVRPLINAHKSELLVYAKKHKLRWREDTTNQDVRYARNYIRHTVVPTIDREQYETHRRNLSDINQKLDTKLQGLVSTSGSTIKLRQHDVRGFDLRQAEVVIAYALRQLCPGVELNQALVSQLAYQLLSGRVKIPFALSGFEGIIIVSD